MRPGLQPECGFSSWLSATVSVCFFGVMLYACCYVSVERVLTPLVAVLRLFRPRGVYLVLL
jgi:hypothetical protein